MRQILQSIYKVKIFKKIVPSLLKIYIRIFNVSEVIVENNEIKLYLNLKNNKYRLFYSIKETTTLKTFKFIYLFN